MSLHYFIDGYNLIRSTDWLCAGSIDDQRDRLLQFLEQNRPTGSERNSVTVVFDGHVPKGGGPKSRSVRILFSGDQDADSVIKSRVDELPNGRVAVVVTNDRSIQKWVRGAHAKVLSCSEFLRLGADSASSPRRADKPSAEDERRINEELRRLWKLP